MNGPHDIHLNPTDAIDSDHALVKAFALQRAHGDTVRDRAVALYRAVRDEVRYDPYRIDLSPQGMRASEALIKGYGWCVPKAVLMAATARAAGIPARLGFADVRNHLSTEKLRQTMKTDVFVFHGYTELWIDGAWRKVTTAFNRSLCEKFGLLPLEFDGVNDSLYHPYDQAGSRHMEYVNERGSYDDLPLDEIVRTFAVVYPGMGSAAEATGDFGDDGARERAA